MKAKPILVLCWIQLALAAASILVTAYNNATRPVLQCDFSRVTGIVSDVVPGGAAERAGIQRGDRIVSVNGIAVAPRISFMHFTRAGDAVPIVRERGGARENLRVIAITAEEARQEALQSGGGRALWAVSSYFWYPLNLWMFFLGAFLLLARGDAADARIASIVFIDWAGGNFLADATGIGALFETLPRGLRLAIYLADGAMIAAFFAAALHFALIFVSERPVSRRWTILPYLLALPIFAESIVVDLRHLDAIPRLMAMPSPAAIYLILGPALLVAALVVLGVHFKRAHDLNGRRRLQIVFLALLPGVLGFVVSNILHLFDNYALAQSAELFNSICTMAGSAIFTYAVVRHRIFNIRVLLRRSLQYALARGTLVALMALPAIGLAAYLYVHRRDSLAAVVAGTPAVYLLLILPLAAVIRYRRRLLDLLDRRFFREQYDARNLMLHIVSMVRDGSDLTALSRATLDEVERALHPKHMSLWQLDENGGMLTRTFVRGRDVPAAPIDTGATLVALLRTDPKPLDVQSRATRALIERLPAAERDWLRACDAHLIVPLLIDDRLAGMMILGERMSEEPYSAEDRDLLRSIAAHLALTFDYGRLKGSPSLVWSPLASRSPAPVADELRSCPECNRCYPVDMTVCEFDQRALVREEGIPRTIEDKFIITRVLGRGGMGSVYLATQKRLNRPVAVKVLLGHLVSSPAMRSRFEREARIVARLKHPAIVTVHDFGLLPGGHAYLVMEYLQGQTLRKVVQSGRQPLERALGILRPVGEAVDTAHRAGVVHRDLKPENIMLAADRDTGEESPRVLDFGLAKMNGPIGDDEATIAQTNVSVGFYGTLMYLSPETLSGQPADARSDQYALGLIAYELLAGIHPLGWATDLASIVKGHTESRIEKLSNHAPEVPKHVAAAVHRAMARDAEARFDSVAEMLDALTA